MWTLRAGALCSISLAVSMSVATSAWSQERVGVVTAAIGPVTVARAATTPEPLKFKDPVYLLDRVTTGDNAITRILLGGKVVVTARERSTLTITEVPGLSTIGLTSGRIAVAVDRTRMKPGERVDIRTPNAIAGVRGTVLVVEVEHDRSTVTVLKGLVDVVRVDRRTGAAFGPVTPVAKQQTVTVRDTVLPSRAQSISEARAQQLSKEFAPPVRPIAATAVLPVADEVDRATALLAAMLPSKNTAGDGAVASGSMDADVVEAPTARLNSTPVVSAVPTLSTAPTLTATPLATTAPTLTTTVPTTTLAPTTLVTPVLAPVTSLVVTTTQTLTQTTSTLLQPIVQPVVQTVVQPVTKLLKLP